MLSQKPPHIRGSPRRGPVQHLDTLRDGFIESRKFVSALILRVILLCPLMQVLVIHLGIPVVVDPHPAMKRGAQQQIERCAEKLFLCLKSANRCSDGEQAISFGIEQDGKVAVVNRLSFPPPRSQVVANLARKIERIFERVSTDRIDETVNDTLDKFGRNFAHLLPELFIAESALHQCSTEGIEPGSIGLMLELGSNSPQRRKLDDSSAPRQSHQARGGSSALGAFKRVFWLYEEILTASTSASQICFEWLHL